MEKWRQDSIDAGRPWVIGFDESIVALDGTNSETLRKKLLYDTLFSGAHVEWYLGNFTLPPGGDLRTEDFRTREDMWQYMSNARAVMEEHLPFWAMEPADHLLTGESTDEGGGQVFASQEEAVVRHLPAVLLPSTGSLDLTSATGKFRIRWFDPVSGKELDVTGPVLGGAVVPLGDAAAGAAVRRRRRHPRAAPRTSTRRPAAAGRPPDDYCRVK